VTLDLSIVIVSYRQQALLENCLRSIYTFSSEFSFEIIVIDNNSTPAYEQAIKTQFNDVIWIQSPENLGFSKANNQAVIRASGQYLFFLNSDTVLHDNSIKSVLTAYQKGESHIGLLGPRLLNKDGSIQHQGSLLQRYKYLGSKQTKVGFISGAAVMMSAKLFKDVGGFCEAYFFYNEDMDLCKTVQAAGYDCVYLPEASITHFGGGSTSASLHILESAYMGSLYFTKKFYPRLLGIYKIAIRLDLAFKRLYNARSAFRFDRKKLEQLQLKIKDFK
jgi:GT2 family glycosyltransferase